MGIRCGWSEVELSLLCFALLPAYNIKKKKKKKNILSLSLSHSCNFFSG